MVASTYDRRSSNWIRIGCLLGLAACLGCGAQPPEFPGDKEYAEGCKLMADGDLKGAIDTFGAAIEKNPRNTLAYFSRAAACQRQGKADDAVRDFSKALFLDREYAAAYSGRAAAYLEKGRVELASDDLTKTISLAPDSREAYCLRARANLLAGKYADAVEDAQSAIRLNAERDDAPRTSGPSLPPLPSQQRDRTVEYVVEAIQSDKTLTPQGKADLARAYFNWGVNLTGDGKRLEAEIAFGEARRLDSNYDKLYVAYQEKTGRAINGGTQRSAAMPINGTLPILPESTLPQLKLKAFDALKQRQFGVALAEFTHILEIDAKCDDASVWCGRGRSFLEMNDPVSAIPDFDRAIYLAPDFSLAYCLRGQAYRKMGNYYRAISETTKAIGLKPDYALAYFDRARAQYEANSLDLALADLGKAVNLDPELEGPASSVYAEIYESQANICLAAQRWGEAIAKLEKAIAALEKASPFDKSHVERLNSLRAKAYGERGFARAKHGEFPEAVRDLNTALDLDKGNAQTCRLCGLTCCLMAKNWHDRGLLTLAKERWQAAIVYLKWAIQLAPELKPELQPELEDAQRSLARISPPAIGMPTSGL